MDYVKPVQEREQWAEGKPSVTAAQTKDLHNSSIKNFKLYILSENMGPPHFILMETFHLPTSASIMV